MPAPLIQRRVRLSRAEQFKRIFPGVPVPYAKPGSLEAHQRARAGLEAVFDRGEQIAGAVFGEAAAPPPPVKASRKAARAAR